MARFLVLGDYFPVSDITSRLQIEPTETYIKGDLSKYGNVKKETCWTLSTGYEESEDVNEQLSKILARISGKLEVLKNLQQDYHLEFSFMIVFHVIGNEKPVISLERNVIHFASEIDAPIRFDYYIYPDE